MLIVLCYDVGDDRRRLRLYQVMQGYGRAVQRSVFECELTASELERLRRRVRRIIDPAADSVRLYVLCEGCAGRVEVLAGPPVERPPDFVIV